MAGCAPVHCMDDGGGGDAETGGGGDAETGGGGDAETGGGGDAETAAAATPARGRTRRIHRRRRTRICNLRCQ